MTGRRALAAVAVVAALLYLAALVTDRPGLRLASKPVPALALAALVLSSRRDGYGTAVAGGLVPDPNRLNHRWWEVSKWMWEDVYDTARIDCVAQA